MYRARIIGFALALAAALSTASLAQEALSPDAARAHIFQLLLEGRAHDAEHLARALLKRDPEDREAWLALAQALTQKGQYSDALNAGKTAWTLSEDKSHRYAAALVSARALEADGALMRAQFWLRRAAQSAPNEHARARAVGEFKQTRAADPLSVHLSFAVKPTSNLNNGARSSRVAGGEISGPALALSGLESFASARIGYRLPGSDKRRARLGFSALSRSYTLSDSAKLISPTSKNSDFAFQEIEVSHRTFWAQSGAKGTALGFRVGSNWSGGTHLSEFAGARVSRHLSPNRRTRLSFGAGVERIKRRDSALRSATVHQAFGTWARGFKGGARMGVSLNISDTKSRSVLTDHSAARLAGTWTLAQTPMGAQVDLNLALEARNYHQNLPLFGQRQDKSATFGVNVTLKNQEYYGFAPTIGVTARSTASTVDLYDSETIGVRLGLRSVF